MLLRLGGGSVPVKLLLGGTDQSEDGGTPGPFVSMLRRWVLRARPAQHTEGCLSCPRVARELDRHSGDTAGGHGFQPQVPWHDTGGAAQG